MDMQEIDPIGLESRLDQLEALVIKGPTGGLRVVDKAARFACDVAGDAVDKEIVARQVESFLSRCGDQSSTAMLRIGVDVVSEALALNGIDSTLAKLCQFLGPIRFAQIKVHFGTAPRDWSLILDRLHAARGALGDQRNVEFLIVGPFIETAEVDMERLFAVGARVRFAAGWSLGNSASDRVDVDRRALRQFSEFGFRAAIEWYVHAQNTELLDERLTDLLLANYNSGLSLPLVSASPFYRFDHGFPALPSAPQYCDLLVRCYRKFPYYDDILSPLVDLALLVREGGWHFGWNVPKGLQFFINADGRISMYRQAPSLGQQWMEVGRFAEATVESLVREFREFIHDSWQWDRNEYCRLCRWRHICGGLDGFRITQVQESALDSMCNFRKLFLEHFARLRGADQLISGR